jgi:hypothetical protein
MSWHGERPGKRKRLLRKRKPQRCAIYTRKSTVGESNLEVGPERTPAPQAEEDCEMKNSLAASAEGDIAMNRTHARSREVWF